MNHPLEGGPDLKEIVYKNNLFSIITEFAIWSVTWKISADRYFCYKLTTLVSGTIKLDHENG